MDSQGTKGPLSEPKMLTRAEVNAEKRRKRYQEYRASMTEEQKAQEERQLRKYHFGYHRSKRYTKHLNANSKNTLVSKVNQALLKHILLEKENVYQSGPWRSLVLSYRNIMLELRTIQIQRAG